MRRKLLNEVRLHSIRRTVHTGEFCRAVPRVPAHTRRTAASRCPVWKRPRNQFLVPRTGHRAYLLYHSISHVSSSFFPLPLHNGRVVPLMYRPSAALPYAALTYNSKRDGHCTFLPSLSYPFYLMDVSHLQYSFRYIAWSL
jgi:hypothetical protein